MNIMENYNVKYHYLYFYFSRFYSTDNMNTPKGKYWKEFYSNFNTDFLISVVNPTKFRSRISLFETPSLNSISFLASEYIAPVSDRYDINIGTKTGKDQITKPRGKLSALLQTIANESLKGNTLNVGKKLLGRIIISMLLNSYLWDKVFSYGIPFTSLMFTSEFNPVNHDLSEFKFLFNDVIAMPKIVDMGINGVICENMYVQRYNISESLVLNTKTLEFTCSDVFSSGKKLDTISDYTKNIIFLKRLERIIPERYVRRIHKNIPRNREQSKPYALSNKIQFNTLIYDYIKIDNNEKGAVSFL